MPQNLSTFPRSSRSLVHFSAICDWAGNAIAALIAPRMVFRYENLCHIVLSYQNVNSSVYIRHTTQFSLTPVLPGVVQVGTSPLYAHGRWAAAIEPCGLSYARLRSTKTSQRRVQELLTRALMGLVVPRSPVMSQICAYTHLICAHIAHWPLRGRVVIKRESGYITKTSHPCISDRGWILKFLRTPQGDVEYPYINQ